MRFFSVNRARDWKGWLTKEAKCAAPERSEALQSPASARLAITLLSHLNFPYIGNEKMCVLYSHNSVAFGITGSG
jgi:hypothetical protein